MPPKGKVSRSTPNESDMIEPSVSGGTPSCAATSGSSRLREARATDTASTIGSICSVGRSTAQER
eukprot:2039608-Pleurochrysis_carterae.AAC.1